MTNNERKIAQLAAKDLPEQQRDAFLKGVKFGYNQACRSWYDAKHVLPPEGREVLVYTWADEMIVAFRKMNDDGEMVMYEPTGGEFDYDGVVVWQYLPASPKSE